MLRRRTPLLSLAVLAAALTTLAACGSDTAGPTVTTAPRGPQATGIPGTFPPGAPTAFYQVPDPLPPGAPGDIIRSQPFPDAPPGAQAWLVMYHSTGLDGEDIAVTGVVLAPDGPAPAEGRKVVSWAHPTTGIANDCAPSLTPALFYTIIPDLQAMLQAGYVVAATDYQGMGTDQVVPYLVGTSAGRSVLDAARAARKLDGTGAGDQVAAWGWSQGGHAALFAGQLARDYAPDLRLAAVAADAPASELAAQLDADIGTADGVTLGAYAVESYQAVYGDSVPGLDVNKVLTPEGVAAMPQIVDLCNLVPTQAVEVETVVGPLVGKFFQPDPAAQEPWAGLLEENSAGRAPTPAPMRINQGSADQVVVPATTESFVDKLCAMGQAVQYQSYPNVTHEEIGFSAAGDTLTWLGQRFAGDPAPSTCPAGAPGTTTAP